MTSTTSGGTGDFKATSLSPSATWQVGLQTGDFTWSYPLRVPPPIGGSAPSLALAYDSGASDGETAQTNSQPGQIGEGFSLAGGGFVERKYESCSDLISNASEKTGDLCWGADNAYLDLNGHATEIIKDSSTGKWRLASDDGSQVLELGGASNGAHAGRYWEVITPDGTQYYFGMNELPGWASGDPTTNSAWTVPVYALNPGDPCYSSSGYASSHCDQGWRWNLDLVVDPDGNATEYFYDPETSYYASDVTCSPTTGVCAAGTPRQYTTGGTLAQIDYGSQMPNVYSRRPIQVQFTYADRCTSSSQSTCDANHDATYWPDTPWDLSCSSSSNCSGVGHQSPTFFDTQMLSSVKTRLYEGSAGWVAVDTWALAHTWLSAETDDLWLSSITHTGDVGGSLALNPVTFGYTAMVNRVPGDNYPAMTRYRISTITTETGSHINVTYNAGDCGSSRPDPSTDTLPCFQQWWTPGDPPYTNDAPVDSWFYKYTVAEVDVADPTGGEPSMPTFYHYGAPGAAWHYDTDIDMVKAKYKSYSQWRGYEHVRVVTGASAGTQSETDYTFMRGMDQDPLPGGGFSSVTVSDSKGTVTLPDSERANGFLLEKITLDGPGGAQVSDQVNQPWLSPATATSAQQQWGGTLTAVLEGTAQTDTYAPLASGGTRHTQVQNTYDPSHGLLTQVSDLGDVSAAGQALCASYSYAQNTVSTAWLLDYVSEKKVTAGACGTSSPPLISDTRYLYDGGAFGDAPTNGNVTETDVYDSGDPGVAAHWVKRSRDSYDSYGRVVSSQDAAGNTTTTTYSSSFGAGRATTQIAVTDPPLPGQATGYTATTDLNPEWGSPKDTIDVNGEETSYAYDALGRVTSIWLPGQSQPAGDAANYTFSYHMKLSPPAVTTNRLIDASAKLYVTSYQIYDSLLRPRQTQAPAEGAGGGTEVTDTFYDSRGNVVIQNGPYPISSAPSTSLWVTTEPQIPNETASVYDGAGRITSRALDSYGAQKWQTTWAYPGADAVTKTPPSGGTITTTWTDARGHTTEIDQYHSKTSPSGAFDATTYAYTPAGQLAGITDPAGNSWSYTYDTLGQQVTADTPDTGQTTSAYDDRGLLASATDGAGQTVSYTYDPLGRKTAEYNTTGGASQTSSDQVAAWTYDSAAAGQLASATSYVGGTGGAAYTQTINSYSPSYQPTSTTWHIPATSVDGALGGDYTFTATYNVDGSLASQTYPAAGGLPAETVYHGYDNLGSPYSTWSSLSDYVEQSFYAPDGQPAEYDLGTAWSAQWSRALYSYDAATARLTESRVQQEATNWGNVSDVSYGYNDAGDVTSAGDSATGDFQCFAYDWAQRLRNAWAQGSAGCPSSPPSATGLGGPAPYLQQLTYDSAGNMTASNWTYAGGSTQDTASAYPPAGSSQPHTLSTQTTTASGGGTSTTSYTWTPAGQLASAATGGTTTAYTWNASGQAPDRLAKITTGSSSTIYRYGASGNLLIQDGNGTVTAFLPGEELTSAGTTVTATRYYTHGGQTIAARTPAGLWWLFPDPHGTDKISINTATQAATWRMFTPFGVPRGSVPASWPGDHGFAGGTTDPTTGLTNLGAREYNPAAPAFISPDPLQNPYIPQDLNPYTYAGDNPVTSADPTGLCSESWCPPPPTHGSGGGSNYGPGHGSGISATDSYTAAVGPVAVVAPSESEFWAAFLRAYLESRSTMSYPTGQPGQLAPGAPLQCLNPGAGGCGAASTVLLAVFAKSICDAGGLTCQGGSASALFGIGLQTAGGMSVGHGDGNIAGAGGLPEEGAPEEAGAGADIGATTAHGAERVAGAGATRGGVLSPDEILNVRSVGEVWSQADGATVRILQNGASRYDIVVEGDRGLITTFKNLSQKSFDRLANNYGWTP